MYGLVNKGLQDYLVAEYGKDGWEKVREGAGVGVECFQSMDSFDDAVTYSLVGKACELFQVEASALLEDFGLFWMKFAAREGYGSLLELAGGSVSEFLQGLDHMHTRVALSFPDLKPPSFECSDITNSGLRLHYYSDRPGLAPFVIGLVKGVGEHFGQKVDVTHERSKADGAEHDEFIVTFVDG